MNECRCGGPVDIDEVETNMWWVHGGMIVFAKCRNCGQVYRANLTLNDFKEEVDERSERIAT